MEWKEMKRESKERREEWKKDLLLGRRKIGI